MECELCDMPLRDGEAVVPVGMVMGAQEIIPRSRGIHLECLKGVYDRD